MSGEPLINFERKPLVEQEASLGQRQRVDASAAELPQRTLFTANKSAAARKAGEFGNGQVVVPEVVKLLKRR